MMDDILAPAPSHEHAGPSSPGPLHDDLFTARRVSLAKRSKGGLPLIPDLSANYSFFLDPLALWLFLCQAMSRTQVRLPTR